MPDYYSPNPDAWHDPVAEIDDSDAPDASDFNLPTENLADNAAWVKKRMIDGVNGGTYFPDPLIFGKGSLVEFNGEADFGWTVNFAGEQVTSLTPGAVGSTYTHATVTIAPPPGFPTSGQQATATAIIAGGQVTGYLITNTGDGYDYVHPPSVTVTGDGTGATATANVQAFLRLKKGAELHVENFASIQLESGGLIHFAAGSGFTGDAGASAVWGGELDFPGVFELSGQFHVEIGAHFYVDSSGTLQVSSGGTLALQRGEDLQIQDNTNPTYNPARTKSLAQPLVRCPTPNPFAGTPSLDSLVSTSGGEENVALTRLPNGSQLTNIVVRVDWSSPHTPGTLASITIFKTKLSDGTRTSLATRTIDPSGSSGFAATLNLGTPETIDDTLYAYTVQYSGESGLGFQNVTWRAPIATFNVANMPF